MARFRPGPGLDARIAQQHAVPHARRLADALADRMRANAPDAGAWITAQDERVRPTHRDADGQTIPANLRYVLDRPSGGRELAQAPRDPDLSLANRINCFPGWVEAEAVGLRGSVWAWYSGPLVRLWTASGREFASTPNHPVLTDRGWVAAGQLKVGDYCVNATRADLRKAGDLSVEPDVEHGPAPLGEIHGALAQMGRAHRVPRGAVYLYGDPVDGDVEVVRADRQLLVHREPASTQLVGQPLLALTDLPRSGPGLGFQLLLRSTRAAASGVRRAGERVTLFRRGVRHALLHRSGPVARLNPSGQQQTADREATDAIRTGERLLRLPGTVSTDQLVHVDVRDWSGHVYTLSTDIGAYTVAGGIVVANCRCLSVHLPGVIAERVQAGDVVLRRAAAHASVSVTFPRVVESEYPDAGDSGGGWVRRSIEEVAAARAPRGR